jgi:uncharacterized CHY-type Zn-finger protein
MTSTFGIHLCEEELEEYAFNRLLEGEMAVVEEHLLVCGVCRKALQTVDEYILLMKLAAADYDASVPSPPRSGSRFWESLGRTAFRRVWR